MRIRLLGVVVLVLATVSLAQARQRQGTYSLALGDSLAIGIQPSSGGLMPTSQGYVDDLYALLRLRAPSLLLQKLGCSGETSTSMIYGGECAQYPAPRTTSSTPPSISCKPIRTRWC
jgi:hypothetical protein